tara:strand:+ start:3348 stop:3851 length:504 start_codon:yes stop_codon:yes gene_type:complete
MLARGSTGQGRERRSIHTAQKSKGKMMKKWFLVCLMFVTPLSLADGHGELGLEKRQPDAPMNVTSVVLGEDVTSVSAEGDMEGYGKVYVTYHLSYNGARTGGTVDGQGRGFTPDGYASGRFQGFWELVDGVVVMRNVVNITDNTMNLDVIKFNPLTRELVVQAYILK